MGHRVHVGGAEAGDEVQGAGTGGGEDDARTAAGASVAVGHVGGALLVAHQDVLELGVIGQALIDRQVRPAGVAEDEVDALLLQRLQHQVRSGHFVSLQQESPRLSVGGFAI